MKRLLLAVVGVGMVAVAGSALAAQNIRFGVGGGLLLPLSDYKTNDKAGWVAGVDGTYWLTGQQIGIRVEGDYSQTSEASGVAAHKTKILGGTGNVVYALGKQADQMRPYVFGGIGIYNVKIDVTGFGSASTSKVGFGGGAGVAFKVGAGSTRLFVEGRFTSISTSGGSTSFIPIRAGLRFGGK